MSTPEPDGARFQQEIRALLDAERDFPGESDSKDQQPWRWRVWLFLEDCIKYFSHQLLAIFLTGSGGFVLFFILSNGSNLAMVIISLGWFIYGLRRMLQGHNEFRDMMFRGGMWES